jgi:hypothetical protein
MSSSSKISTQTPGALILAFRRQENLHKILKSLRDGGISRIYLSIDGPRDNEDVKTAASILGYIEDFCAEYSLELKVLRPEKNLGLALAVLTALDWFFSQEDSGLVIEDDLYFESDFIVYCREALTRFEADREVWIISGNRFDDYIVSSTSNSWSTYPMIWGWATWANRWPEIRDAITSITFSDKTSARCSVRGYWKVGLRRVNSGILNSWAVPLAVQMRFNKKYCLLPPVNLVSNVGIDSEAEHTSHKTWHTYRAIENLPAERSFESSNRIQVAEKSNILFERKIYRITSKNVLTWLFSIFGDWFRFPKKLRSDSLRSRYKAIQNLSQ